MRHRTKTHAWTSLCLFLPLFFFNPPLFFNAHAAKAYLWVRSHGANATTEPGPEETKIKFDGVEQVMVAERQKNVNGPRVHTINLHKYVWRSPTPPHPAPLSLPLRPFQSSVFSYLFQLFFTLTFLCFHPGLGDKQGIVDKSIGGEIIKVT